MTIGILTSASTTRTGTETTSNVVIDIASLYADDEIIQPANVASSDLFTNKPSNDGYKLSKTGTVRIRDKLLIASTPSKLSNQGEAYIWKQVNNREWNNQIGTITANNGATNDFFGSAVDISGNYAVVSATGKDTSNGSVYFFVYDGSSWVQKQEITNPVSETGTFFGYSIRLNDDASTLIVSGSDVVVSSNCYIYTRSGNTWTEQANVIGSDITTGDRFGRDVDISGNTIAVSANHQDAGGTERGAVYVFTESGGTWTQQQKITANNAADNDDFGYAIALENDTLVVGAPYKDNANSNSGSIYIFTRSGGTWTQQQELTVTGLYANSYFGSAIGISNNVIAVSAPQQTSSPGFAMGVVYTFEKIGSSWVLKNTMPPASGANGDRTGSSISISGKWVAIGIPARDIGGTNRGAIFLNDLQPVSGIVTVIINNASATDSVASVKYQGVEFTRVVQAPDAAGEPGRAQIWYLGNGDVPENKTISDANVTISFKTAITDDYHMYSAFLVGNGNIAFVSANSTSGDQANPSRLSLSLGRECLHIGALFSGLAAPPTVSGVTLSSIDFGNQAGIIHRVTALGNTTNETLSVTSASDDVAYVTASFTDAELLQEKWRWRNDDGSETTATYAGANNANVQFNAYSDAPVRLRFALSCPGTYPNVQPVLESSHSRDYQGWQVKDMVSDSKSFATGGDHSGQIARSIFWKPDSTKFYVCVPGNDRIYSYTMSEAGNVASATYDNKTISIATNSDLPFSIFIKDDGLTMYVVEQSTDNVDQYTLSTAWDITTATYDNKTFSVSGQDSLPYGVWFKPDGTKMYVNGSTNDSVYQYSLSTAWDISTASYDSVSFSASEEGTPYGFTMSTDGDYFFITGVGSDDVHQYVMSTPWDLSTAEYVGFFDLSGLGANPHSTVFNINGSKAYVLESTNDTIYQFSLSTYPYWRNVTTSSSFVRAIDSTNVTANADTTQQISEGTFISPNSGISESGVAGLDDDMDFTPNTVTEAEFAIEFISADLQASDEIWFRIKNADTRLGSGYAVATIVKNAPPTEAANGTFLIFFM